MKKITEKMIDDFKNYLLDNEKSKATLEKEEHSLKIKTLKIQKRIFAKKEKELTKAESNRLLKAAKAKGGRKLYLLMQTICATGIRVSEVQ